MRALRVIVILFGGLLLGFAAYVSTGGDTSTLVAPATTTSTTAPTPSTTTSTTVPPTTTTMAATTTTEARQRLVIHGTGDVNTDTSYIPALAANGHEYAWDGLDGLFVDDDLTVINLECTPSELGEPLDKAFVFRCDPESLPVMREMGVEVVNLANNHSADYGPVALVDGRQQVEDAGLLAVGVGADIDAATEPALVDVNGWRVAVVGFGGVVPNASWLAGPDSPGMADGDTIDTMVAAVEAAAEIADLVVVTVHWGMELDTQPRDDDRARAEALIEAGADMIFGHHPHRLQPLEMIDGVPVAWSLGNFVWPRLSEAGSTTAVARVVVEPNGQIDACLIPAYIASSGHPELRGDPEC